MGSLGDDFLEFITDIHGKSCGYDIMMDNTGIHVIFISKRMWGK